jgi:hypothetical protein
MGIGIAAKDNRSKVRSSMSNKTPKNIKLSLDTQPHELFSLNNPIKFTQLSAYKGLTTQHKSPSNKNYNLLSSTSRINPGLSSTKKGSKKPKSSSKSLKKNGKNISDGNFNNSFKPVKSTLDYLELGTKLNKVIQTRKSFEKQMGLG